MFFYKNILNKLELRLGDVKILGYYDFKTFDFRFVLNLIYFEGYEVTTKN